MDQEGKQIHGQEVTSDNWADFAGCRGTDPDTFFPHSRIKAILKEEEARAKSICFDGCPVRLECLEYAISNGIKYGIWGGATEKERRQILRRNELANGSEQS